MNMKLDLKRIAGLVMGAALVIFLVYAFLPQPVPVDMSEVTRGPMLVTVSDDGMTRVRDLYEVSAPVSGNVIRIELEPGDPVIAGETVLAYLQPVDPTLLDRRTAREAEAAVQAAEAALSLARSEVESAEAELEFANAEFNRYQTLAETNTASAAALDRARLNQARGSANLSTARSAVAVRAAELETARAYLITATSGDGDLESEGLVPIRSPIDGEVLAVQHESAGVVRAGEVLIEVGNPQDIEIVVDLLSTDAVKVSEGADVLIGGGVAVPCLEWSRPLNPRVLPRFRHWGLRNNGLTSSSTLSAKHRVGAHLAMNFASNHRLLSGKRKTYFDCR